MTAAQIKIIEAQAIHIRQLEEAVQHQKEIAALQADDIARLKLLLRTA